MDLELADLKSLAAEKIQLAQTLRTELARFESIDGVLKTSRKINQEIKFLQKVVSNETIKLSHVTCSNLTHYAFLVKVLERQKDVVEVDAAVNADERETPLRVDIICEGGRKWIKVVARNSKSIRDAALGNSGFGAKSIIDQAEEYVSVADQNLFMFKPPTVVFLFSNAIDDDLKSALEETGVVVTTSLTGTHFDDIPVSLNTQLDNIDTLNLDITAMLAYVSSLTNGSNCWEFNEPILNQQSEWEAQSPVKPILDQLFEGKRLICCKSAVDSFMEIISMLAGPSEKIRADELVDRLEIYDDIDTIPDDLAMVNVGGKIKSRSLRIFAFGIGMKAVTVTSNEGFIRSAKMKGVNIPVYVIQARALTESKQLSAKRIESRSSVL